MKYNKRCALCKQDTQTLGAFGSKYNRPERRILQSTSQHVTARHSTSQYVTTEEFRDHFLKLYSIQTSAYVNRFEDYEKQVGLLDHKFTVIEIECAIKHMEQGKTAGNDEIRSDFIVCEKGNLKYVLTKLFHKFYSTSTYPEQLCAGVIVPIYKNTNIIQKTSRLQVQ